MECNAEPVVEGKCQHMVMLEQAMVAPPFMAPQGILAWQLSKPVVASHTCAAIRHWLIDLLAGVAADINVAVDDMEPPENLLKAIDHPMGAKRKLRLDEDFGQAS